MDSSPQLDIQCEGQRTRRTRFVWCQGFLKAQKPPLRRPTPLSRQHRHTPPANKRPSNIPSAWPADSNTVFTTGKRSEQSSFLQRYDLRLNLRGTDGDTYSEWEGVTNLLSQMKEIDNKIEVLPWAVTDQNHHNPPIAITTIACTFFDLQIYVPGLANVNANLRTRLELGDMQLSSLLLRLSVQPTQLVEKL